ncbi:MAG: glycosyltransferase [Bacteroidia bacterium]|nr:glycosyltransferase [Bacteroidia bacterium]
MNKIKVFFITPTLYGGGAERVISYIPQFINKEQFDVTLVVIGFEKDSTYEVSGIPILYLNKTRVFNAIFSLIKIITTEKPKIVVGTLSHLNTVLGYISLLFPKTKFIGRHCIVNQTTKILPSKKASLKNKLNKNIYKLGYDLLDIVLCQSKDMFYDMQDNSYSVSKKKLRIIHNPMRDNFRLKLTSSQNEDILKFITVARLVKLKGHDRILAAISKLNYPYQYTIVGDGPEKNKIFELIDQLGIRDKIVHVPYTSEVSKYLEASDYYLQGAHAEGFPNCLIESCSVGTPVIAYNAPGGLNEIIADGLNGFLVENENEFIAKLNESHNWNPKKIRESVHRKFNLDKIVSDYEKMFLEILN